MMRSNAGRWWACLGLLAAAIGSSPCAAAGKPDQKAAIVASPAQPERREGRPRIFLSWDAPYGMPRASDTRNAACDDTTAADTLYLSFDPGEDLSALLGIDAALTFRAAPGDSLGPFWDLSRKGVNPWNLRIEFDEPPAGAESPWPVSGMGAPQYILGPESGRLKLTYFVNASHAGPIAAGTRYFFARVMLRLRKPYLEGCRQPVCVELNFLKVSYSGGGRWINEGERFVCRNSAGGAACQEHRLRPPEPEPMPRRVPAGAAPDSVRR